MIRKSQANLRRYRWLTRPPFPQVVDTKSARFDPTAAICMHFVKTKHTRKSQLHVCLCVCVCVQAWADIFIGRCSSHIKATQHEDCHNCFVVQSKQNTQETRVPQLRQTTKAKGHSHLKEKCAGQLSQGTYESCIKLGNLWNLRWQVKALLKRWGGGGA